MEVLLFLVAAFIVWHFIPRTEASRPSPKFRSELRGVASDPNWIRFFEEHCESPAETAFLHAIVKAYQLKPADGALTGAGLRLDFQVTEGGYRVDFLADQWLVIEIDGAAYHSSPGAMARDKVRDQDLEALGYSVLRIPAKTVFVTPEEAVHRVRSALQIGKRPGPVQVQKSGWQRLSDTLASIDDGMSELNAAVERKRAVERALQDAKIAFEMEKVVIKVAIDSAQLELETAHWLETEDQSTRELYEDAVAELEEAIVLAGDDEVPSEFDFVPFPAAPSDLGQPEHIAAIKEGYKRIVVSRTQFLEAQRVRVIADPKLSPIVEKELGNLGCPEYWAILFSAADNGKGGHD